MIDDRTYEGLLFRCSFCGESLEAEGNDPYEMLLTVHYCPTALSPDVVDREVTAA